jgi:nicotinamidase-related amidase
MELDPRKTALIGVHFQNDIVTAEGAFGGMFAPMVEKHNVLENAKSVLDSGREAGATIVYTRVAWAADYSDLVPNCALLGGVPQAQCLVDGSPAAEIVDALAPQDGDVIMTHKRVGAFSATQLDTILRTRGIDTVAVFGVATNISVESTARQASDLGYRTIIVSDASSAADEPAHEATLATMGLLSEIATVAEVTEGLKGAVPA